MTIALVYRGVTRCGDDCDPSDYGDWYYSVGDVQWGGVMSTPPSIAPTLMQMNIADVFEVGMISVVFAFLFVDLFDTAGTLVGVATKART